jgi:tetratricopeptide (TPR) repeat protein
MKNNVFYRAKSAFLFIFGVLILAPVFSQSSFSQGEEFFIQNRPQEALEFLEAAVQEDPSNVQAFLYLGIIYQQLDRIDDAISVYQTILDQEGTDTARIAFNLGNAYLIKGSLSLAVQSYTQALEVDPDYSPALLNRANAQVQMGSLIEAAADYERYLSLESQSAQAAQIGMLISYIREEFAAQERLKQEELAAQEAARLAAEEAVRQELERRQRFLSAVSASLETIAEDSRRFFMNEVIQEEEIIQDDEDEEEPELE